MKRKNVYVNEKMIGEGGTWGSVHQLLSERGITFVNAPTAVEGPDAFFMRGEVANSDPSKPAVDSGAQSLAAMHPGISERAAAIAQGLVNTGRAKCPQPDKGMLRLECLDGGFYWISSSGDQVLRGSSQSEADELRRKIIDDMERAGTR